MAICRWLRKPLLLRGLYQHRLQAPVWRRKILTLWARFLPLAVVSLVLCTFVLLLIDDAMGPIPYEYRLLPSRLRSCHSCFHNDYPILTNRPHLCTKYHDDQVIDMVIFIESHPNNIEARTAIRNTWANISRNNTSNFRHVFVFGQIPNPVRMRLIEEEGERFGDVVISDFVDVYNNLTLKTLTSLRWVSRYCSNARYFFKTDDDVWVNASAILKRFDASQNDSSPRALMGRCRMSSMVIRNRKSKWYASYQSYPEDAYPQYCAGTGYGGDTSIARRVVDISKNVPFFHVEDVYVGLCAEQLEIPLIHIKDINGSSSWDPCDGTTPPSLTYHSLKPERLYKLWQPRCATQKDMTTAHQGSSLLLDVLFLMQ